MYAGKQPHRRVRRVSASAVVLARDNEGRHLHRVIEDGWKADVREVVKKKGAKKVEGTIKVGKKEYICELLPKDLLVKRFFESDWEELQQLEMEKESKAGELEELV